MEYVLMDEDTLTLAAALQVQIDGLSVKLDELEQNVAMILHALTVASQMMEGGDA